MKGMFLFLFSSLLWAAGCSKDKNSQQLPPQTVFPKPDWQVDQTGKYPVSMTAVIQLSGFLPKSSATTDKLAVFIGNECRGLGAPVTLPGGGTVYYFMIHGTSDENAKWRLRYYNATTMYMFETAEIADFIVDGNLGTVDEPIQPSWTQLK